MSEIQGKPVYGVCACKEKVQVLSVDQVVDLIQQMAANDWQVPADYIPKTSVNGIVEQKSGDEIKLWIGKQAEYDALTDEEKAHKFAIITDDPTVNEISTQIQNLKEATDNLSGRLDTLGFKEGSVNVLSNGNVTAFNTTQNILQRQGNYVLGNVVLELITSAFAAQYYLYGEVDAFELPDNFKIKEGENLTIIGTTGSSYYKFENKYVNKNKFYVTSYYAVSGDSNPLISLSFGYEAEPLEE